MTADPMPAHGQRLWHGGANLPPHSEARSILTGEKLTPVVTVGSVILPDAMNNAVNPGRHGMVVSIGHDPETGEAVYTVLTHRNIRGRTEAWTFSMPASEVKAENVMPDSSTARHGYATAVLRSVCDGRWVSEEGLRLVGIVVGLVRDCVAGPAVSKS